MRFEGFPPSAVDPGSSADRGRCSYSSLHHTQGQGDAVLCLSRQLPPPPPPPYKATTVSPLTFTKPLPYVSLLTFTKPLPSVIWLLQSVNPLTFIKQPLSVLSFCPLTYTKPSSSVLWLKLSHPRQSSDLLQSPPVLFEPSSSDLWPSQSYRVSGSYWQYPQSLVTPTPVLVKLANHTSGWLHANRDVCYHKHKKQKIRLWEHSQTEFPQVKKLQLSISWLTLKTHQTNLKKKDYRQILLPSKSMSVTLFDKG